MDDTKFDVMGDWSLGELKRILIGFKALVVARKGSSDITEKHIPDEEKESSTWSLRVVDTASKWLGTCIADHKDCSDGQSKFIPSRLIDIGTSDIIIPRLISTADFTDSLRYVSLSHCWGGNVSLRLTTVNLATYSEGISFQAFPTTFQHALIVTRDLKCRYIWIDSLCIIQDSHEDWLRESSQMHLVYLNAYVNIAASAASDSTKGLSFDRNLMSSTPLCITINQSDYLVDPQADIDAVLDCLANHSSS